MSDGPPCFVCGLALVPGNNVIRVERDSAVEWSHGHHDVATTPGVQRGRLAVETVFTLVDRMRPLSAPPVTGDAES